MLRRYVVALAGAALLLLAASSVASAHARGDGWLCYGNVGGNIPMYADGPGQGTVDWIMIYGEGFRGILTVNVNGVFWSYGHSTNSWPYDYWVRTGYLRC